MKQYSKKYINTDQKLYVLMHETKPIGIYTEKWQADIYRSFIPDSSIYILHMDLKPEFLKDFIMPPTATKSGMYEISADMSKCNEQEIFDWHSKNNIPINMYDCGSLIELIFAFEDKNDAMKFKLMYS